MKLNRFYLYRILAFFLLIFISPLLLFLYIVIKFSSKGPFIFQQTRLGINKKKFTIYKIRTMIENAESLKKNFIKLNEADGPVFKIYDDPRYTRIGKLLSHTGLDEVPQLINVIKGDMSFVGPRPLPVNEALKVSDRFSRRFSILPGITSPWILEGAHKLKFHQWMKLDLEYVDNNNLLLDVKIFGMTILLIIKLLLNNVFLFFQ